MTFGEHLSHHEVTAPLPESAGVAVADQYLDVYVRVSQAPAFAAPMLRPHRARIWLRSPACSLTRAALWTHAFSHLLVIAVQL